MKKLLVLCLLFTGCTPALQLKVQKSVSYEQYYTAAYEQRCTNTGNPPDWCFKCRDVINDGAWKVDTANKVYKTGFMPPQEQKELDQLVKDLEASCR